MMVLVMMMVKMTTLMTMTIAMLKMMTMVMVMVIITMIALSTGTGGWHWSLSRPLQGCHQVFTAERNSAVECRQLGLCPGWNKGTAKITTTFMASTGKCAPGFLYSSLSPMCLLACKYSTKTHNPWYQVASPRISYVCAAHASCDRCWHWTQFCLICQ